MLRKTPKPFNAVDVILGTLVDQSFCVADLVMFPQTLQGIVAPERVGVIDRAFSCFLSNDRHQFFFRDMLHDLRIYLAIALQEPKYNVFALGTTPTLALPPAAKVALIHFDLTVQFAALKLCHMVGRFTQALVDAGNRLVVEVQIMGETVRRLLLVETLHDTDLCADALQRFLLSAGFVSAPDVSSLRPMHLKRPAKYALSTLQKVGRTTENVLLPLYHMGILVPYGYETH